MTGLTESQTAIRQSLLREGFLPVGKESYGIFKSYDTGIRQFHELTATVSTIWAFGFDPVYRIVSGFLCSFWFYRSGEVYVYLQPPGVFSTDKAGPILPPGVLKDLVENLYALTLRAGLPSLQIWAVDGYLLAKLQEALSGSAYRINYECSADFSEYVYQVGDIRAWDGGVNLNKRNSLKRCFAAPSVSVRPLSGDNFSACFAVEDEWCSHQDCEACRAFAGCGRDALKNMGEIFDETIYRGLLLYVDGKPIAYAIWEVLGPSGNRTAYVYFAKANITNFNVYLYWTMAKDHLSGVDRLNNGYDMGKPGLRTFKKHLSVHSIMEKYLCTITSDPAT
jgi:hypothetical protein